MPPGGPVSLLPDQRSPTAAPPWEQRLHPVLARVYPNVLNKTNHRLDLDFNPKLRSRRDE